MERNLWRDHGKKTQYVGYFSWSIYEDEGCLSYVDVSHVLADGLNWVGKKTVPNRLVSTGKRVQEFEM